MMGVYKERGFAAHAELAAVVVVFGKDTIPDTNLST